MVDKNNIIKCILCKTDAEKFYVDEKSGQAYFLCSNCDLRFLNPKHYLDKDSEYKRYLTHNNDINDSRYQNFVRPLYDLVKKELSNNSVGLDWGAGSGPVLSYMLSKIGFKIDLYDPYFHPDKIKLKAKYDFVLMIEAIEHFYDPLQEFEYINNHLNCSAAIGVMTSLFDSKINFNDWYYRKDPTHVAFYSQNTFNWIKKKFEFKKITFYLKNVVWLIK